MKTICKHAYPSDLCGTCNPPAKGKADDRLALTTGSAVATIRRKKYPEYYMGWVVEHDAPKWTSYALDAAPIPLEILVSELNKIAARETNIWAVVYPLPNA